MKRKKADLDMHLAGRDGTRNVHLEQPLRLNARDRYEIQTIADASSNTGRHYRLTDVATDSRIATCFCFHNAMTVLKALNLLELSETGIQHVGTSPATSDIEAKGGAE